MYMLTDRNTPELREPHHDARRYKDDNDLYRMSSKIWLSETGSLVTPLADMNNFSIKIPIPGIEIIKINKKIKSRSEYLVKRSMIKT